MKKKHLIALLLGAACMLQALSGCNERLGESSSLLRVSFSIHENGTATRNTPIYTENLGDFDATAFLNRSADGAYDDCWCGIRDAVFRQEEGTGVWSHTFENNERWPDNNGKLVFFLHYPAKAVGEQGTSQVFYCRESGKQVIKLTDYVTPGIGSDTAAEEQTDHVFATTLLSESTRPTENSSHSILFYHPFAAVKFQKGTIMRSDGETAEFSIKAITLKNVYDKGTCTVTPYYGQEGTLYNSANKSNAGGVLATKSAACTVWAINHASTADFRQIFTDEDFDTTPQGTLFPEGFSTQRVGTTYPNAHQINTLTLNKTFILIPQTFDPASHELSMVLDIEINGLLYSREVPIISTVEWKAGGLYTYAVNLTLTDIGWVPTILPVGWHEEGNITNVNVPQNKTNE